MVKCEPVIERLKLPKWRITCGGFRTILLARRFANRCANPTRCAPRPLMTMLTPAQPSFPPSEPPLPAALTVCQTVPSSCAATTPLGGPRSTIGMSPPIVVKTCKPLRTLLQSVFSFRVSLFALNTCAYGQECSQVVAASPRCGSPRWRPGASTQHVELPKGPLEQRAPRLKAQHRAGTGSGGLISLQLHGSSKENARWIWATRGR